LGVLGGVSNPVSNHCGFNPRASNCRLHSGGASRSRSTPMPLWQRAFDRGAHQVRCEERERYRHVDLTHAALLPNTCISARIFGLSLPESFVSAGVQPSRRRSWAPCLCIQEFRSRRLRRDPYRRD
jgi:hypothetical protein